MRIRQEHRNLTKPLKEAIGDQIKLVSGYFNWKKEYIDIVLREHDYTVTCESMISPKKFFKETIGLIEGSTYACVNALSGSISCTFIDLPIWMGGCNWFSIRDKTYNILFDNLKDKKLFCYNSKDSNPGRLKIFLDVVNPVLPEEVFPVLEDMIKDYKLDA
ncbi:MAG: hypothetical protein Q8R00_01365 [Candidatus Nanoarchaeia archaeon]|nr:hypothetical protein [Candidatus Nanoarchaeia archaeon]